MGSTSLTQEVSQASSVSLKSSLQAEEGCDLKRRSIENILFFPLESYRGRNSCFSMASSPSPTFSPLQLDVFGLSQYCPCPQCAFLGLFPLSGWSHGPVLFSSKASVDLEPGWLSRIELPANLCLFISQTKSYKSAALSIGWSMECNIYYIQNQWETSYSISS